MREIFLGDGTLAAMFQEKVISNHLIKRYCTAIFEGSFPVSFQYEFR